MKRRLIALAAVGALALGLTGCAGGYVPDEEPKSDEEIVEDNGRDLYEGSITLSDGREVTCIMYIGIRKGGVSCDWAGAEDPFATTEETE